jgi:regulatory protein
MNYNEDEAFTIAAKYCSRQEVCISQITWQMKKWGMDDALAEKVLDRLISKNYINEERFARAYAGGQFRMNKWGRIKISMGLKQHNISELNIQNGLEEIDETEYIDVLKSLLVKKVRQIKTKDKFTLQRKLATFAIGKGYEPDLVWKTVKVVMNE